MRVSCPTRLQVVVVGPPSGSPPPSGPPPMGPPPPAPLPPLPPAPGSFPGLGGFFEPPPHPSITIIPMAKGHTKGLIIPPLGEISPETTMPASPAGCSVFSGSLGGREELAASSGARRAATSDVLPTHDQQVIHRIYHAAFARSGRAVAGSVRLAVTKRRASPRGANPGVDSETAESTRSFAESRARRPLWRCVGKAHRPNGTWLALSTSPARQVVHLPNLGAKAKSQAYRRPRAISSVC